MYLNIYIYIFKKKILPHQTTSQYLLDGIQ